MGDEEGFAYAGKRVIGDLLTAVDPSEFERVRLQGRYAGRRSAMEGSSDEDEEEDAGMVTLDDMGRKLAAYSMNMRTAANEWQVAKAGQCFAELQRGFFPGVSPDRSPVVKERVFRCDRTYVLDNWNEAGGLYKALTSGRVIARVLAATGFGKSTRLASEIAKRLECRVLQISPDAFLKQEHAKRQTVEVTNQWLIDRTAAVTYMTPLEFCGRFFGDSWRQLFDRFEVIILDEAHIPKGQWYAMKAAFASKESGDTSLLMLSATIAGNDDLQTSKYAPDYMAKTVEDVIGSERFMTSPYAVDRLMVIVESDERLDKIAKMLLEKGCDVYALTKGADSGTIERVMARLEKDSATVRVLVVHERFGTGYNFNVSRVITTGLRSAIHKTSEGYAYKSVPLTASEIKQHMGRAGRGMVDMLGKGLVLLDKAQVADDIDLIPSEEFYTYVLLTAMGIEPCLKLERSVAEYLPEGLTRRVAVSLLNVIGLPVEVSVRFLGKDGRFPSVYGTALQNFSTRSVTYLVSAEKKPYGFEKWTSVKAFGMFKTNDGPSVRIPFKCTGELMTVLVLVCSAAENIYTPMHTPQHEDECSGYESGPEGEAVNGGLKRYSYGYRTPVIDFAPPKMIVHKVQDIPKDTYRYNVPQANQATYMRRRAFIASAALVDELALKSEPVVEYITEHSGAVSVQIVLPVAPEITVASSPGGTPVARMPEEMWKALMNGDLLPYNYVDCLLVILRNDCKAFAFSSAFSNWNNAWLSVLRTFCAPDIIKYVQDKGGIDLVIAFFIWLWERYVKGMLQATQTSNLYRSYWRRLINDDKRSLVELQPNTRLNVAQSNDFKQRLYDIRLNYAYMLVAFEAANIYNEFAVTELQKVLPISRRLGNPLFDAVDNRKADKPYLFIDKADDIAPDIVQRFRTKR